MDVTNTISQSPTPFLNITNAQPLLGNTNCSLLPNIHTASSTPSVITPINTTPASLRICNPAPSLLAEIEEPMTYHLGEVFSAFPNTSFESQNKKDNLWDLSPSHNKDNANVLACLDADLAAAKNTDEKGVMNSLKNTGIEMLRNRLPWLTSAATFSPNMLWTINRAARWSRFLRSAPAPNQHFTLPNPCGLEALIKTDPNATYTGLEKLNEHWLQGYPMDTDKPLAKHLHNNKIAEAFTRLALNDCQTPSGTDGATSKPFTISVDDRQFTTLNDFTDYLQERGYSIEISTASRVADFFGLQYQETASDGTQTTRPVPVPVFFQTNWQAPNHADNGASPTTKATLPIMHSETLIRIKAPSALPLDQTTPSVNSAFDAQLIWLMGIAGIGFKAGDQEKLQAWSYPREVSLVSGEQGWDLVNVMGLLTRTLHDIGQNYKFTNDAYYVEGACNDYAGLLQGYAGQPIQAFPLTLSKDFLVPYLENALSKKDEHNNPSLSQADQQRTKRLLAVLEKFPNDLYAPKDQLDRALSTLPWQPNEPSPWPAVDKERRKLEALKQTI